MRRLAVLAALAAVLIAAPATGQEAPRLPIGSERMGVRGLEPLPVPRRAVNPVTTSRLLIEDKAPITDFNLDRSLSRLCRAGRFRQQREHLFIVRLGGIVYGAVIGGFWGLYDPEGLAVPNLVYALRWQDTGRCEVYVVRHLPA